MSEQQSPNPAEVYEQYFGPALFGPWARVLLEYAAPQSGERVLDMACGTGIVTRHVAPMVGAAGQVVGLDISQPCWLSPVRSPPLEAQRLNGRKGMRSRSAYRMLRSISCCATKAYSSFRTAPQPYARCGEC